MSSKVKVALAGLGDIRVTHINPVRRQVLVEHGPATDPLSLLATIESVVMVGLAMVIMLFSATIQMPNILLLLLGIVAIGVLYTLIGIIMIVRYQSITDFLFPMAGVVVVLQVPFLHFLHVVEHPLFLAVPTSAPTLLMQGAYTALDTWEWVYGIGYSALWIGVLSVWAIRAFRHHVIAQAG